MNENKILDEKCSLVRKFLVKYSWLNVIFFFTLLLRLNNQDVDFQKVHYFFFKANNLRPTNIDFIGGDKFTSNVHPYKIQYKT